MLSGTAGYRPGNMAALSGFLTVKLVQKEKMHPHVRAKIPSLGSTARVHVNPIDCYQCSNELRAQLNLTNDHKRKKYQTCKEVLLPRMSCKRLRSVS